MGVEAEVPSPGCVQRIAEDYDIFSTREGLPPLSIGNYTYGDTKCYALLDTTALDASGITRLQNQPVLALKAKGSWWASSIPA